MIFFVCVNDLQLRGCVKNVLGTLQLDNLMLINHRVGGM